MRDSVIKILEDTNKLLRSKKYWTKGANQRWVEETKNTSYCLQGALECAGYSLNTFNDFSEAKDILRTQIRGQEDNRNIVAYNDQPRRKFEDIKALLKRAIKKAKALKEERGVS